jgi:hypothetical protein
MPESTGPNVIATSRWSTRTDFGRQTALQRRRCRVRRAAHTLPVQSCALTAVPKRPTPMPRHLTTEHPDRLAISGHGVVGEVPSHHASQPLPLHEDRLMPAPREFLFDLPQLRPHPLRDRDALEHETPVPGPRTDVCETQEMERLRPPEATHLPGTAVVGGVIG